MGVDGIWGWGCLVVRGQRPQQVGHKDSSCQDIMVPTNKPYEETTFKDNRTYFLVSETTDVNKSCWKTSQSIFNFIYGFFDIPVNKSGIVYNLNRLGKREIGIARYFQLQSGSASCPYLPQSLQLHNTV